MTTLIALFLSLAATAQPTITKPFKNVKCPAPEAIAKSYLELETSGLRVSRKCIDAKAYPFLNVGNPPRGSEEGVPQTSKIANETKPFTIDKLQKRDATHYTVSFRYHIKEGVAVKDVSDVLGFDVLQGPAKDRMGCALEAQPPKTLVIRANCDH